MSKLTPHSSIYYVVVVKYSEGNKEQGSVVVAVAVRH